MRYQQEPVTLEYQLSEIIPTGKKIIGFNRNQKTIAIFTCGESEVGRMLWIDDLELSIGQSFIFGGYKRKVINQILKHNIYTIECTDPKLLSRNNKYGKNSSGR